MLAAMAELGENEILSWEFSDSDNLLPAKKLGVKNASEDLVIGSSSHVDVVIPLGSGTDHDDHHELVSSVMPLSPSTLPPNPIERKKRKLGIELEKTLELAAAGEDLQDDQGIHIWTERERRKKMKNMYTNLHALLPQLSPKADKSTIVDEAVKSIQSLQQTFQKFQRQKLERLHGMGPLMNYDSIVLLEQQQQQQQTISREAFMADYVSNNNNSPHDDDLINFVLPNNFPFLPAFWTWTSPNVVLNVCGEQAHYSVCALKKPGLLSGIYFFLQKHKLELLYCTILTHHASCMYTIHAQMIKGSTADDDQLPDGFPVEQIYKQVAMEINFWVTS